MTRIFFAKKQTFLEAKQVSGLFNRFSIQPLIGRHQKYLPRLSLHWRENGYQVSSNIVWGSKLLERVNKKLETITKIRHSKKFQTAQVISPRKNISYCFVFFLKAEMQDRLLFIFKGYGRVHLCFHLIPSKEKITNANAMGEGG